jgi:cell division protein FtsW (lipid II flippase)
VDSQSPEAIVPAALVVAVVLIVATVGLVVVVVVATRFVVVVAGVVVVVVVVVVAAVVVAVVVAVAATGFAAFWLLPHPTNAINAKAKMIFFMDLDNKMMGEENVVRSFKTNTSELPQNRNEKPKVVGFSSQ